MEPWLRISLLLSGFGAIKEFRPSEPFIAHYLEGPWKNFTEAEVNQKIFPVETYSQLVELVVIFLVTDLLRYKPIIILEGLAGIVAWTLLIWGETLLSMQVMKMFFGLFIAAEVAYYTYIYAQVDRNHYQRVTSHTRAAFLIGRFISGMMSQILVSFAIMDYYQLNFISLTSVTIATVWALFLPPAKSSIYFHRERSSKLQLEGENAAGESLSNNVLPAEELLNGNRNSKLSFWGRCKMAYYYLWKDFKMAYSNMYVLKWSFWWALATCGYVQAISYVQLIWENIVKENNSTGNYELYNGALMSLLCGCLPINWKTVGDVILAVASFLQAVLLLGLTWTNSLFITYVCFVAFGVIYNTMITVANAEVAMHISEDSCALIFGINTFFYLVSQTLLTTIVVVSIDLPIRTQFHVYGGYFAAIGGIFLVIAAYELGTRPSNKILQVLSSSKENTPNNNTKNN